MANPILIDFTEFINKPNRSGIQRVCKEIITNSHKDGSYRVIYIDPMSNLSTLPEKVCNLIENYFNCEGSNFIDFKKNLDQIIKKRTLIKFDCLKNYKIFNPELFYSKSRVNFYNQLINANLEKNIYFLVYDFIPFLYPEEFPRNTVANCNPYLVLLTKLNNLKFISDKTKNDYYEKIRRKPVPTKEDVLSLGADSFGGQKKEFVSSNLTFSITSTIRPGKNIDLILDIFEKLWKAGKQTKLILNGKLDWPTASMSERIKDFSRYSNLFTWTNCPSDQKIKEDILDSRSTIFPSKIEGFGLPPLESLSLGTPVIVGGNIPSVEKMPEKGLIKLSEINHSTLLNAVEKMLDDEFARNLYGEIKLLELPTWKDFGGKIFDWISN